MANATIEGTIPAGGYLHVIYGLQSVDGETHTPWDIVITPQNEDGEVSFTLPQGIYATIQLYPEIGGSMEMEKSLTIPRSERVPLSDLLK